MKVNYTPAIPIAEERSSKHVQSCIKCNQLATFHTLVVKYGLIVSENIRGHNIWI